MRGSSVSAGGNAHLQTDPAIVWFQSPIKEISERWVAMPQAVWGAREVVSR